MTTFQIIMLAILATCAFALCWLVFKKEGVTFNYNKTVTTINKLDEMQLEIAKQNLEELKKYNENAAKQNLETNQAIRTMTTAVQEIMGVNSDEAR